jgi:hypothetical protein
LFLQSLADLEKAQGLCSEICPASSHVAYQSVSIKAEVISDAEEEEYSALITIPRINAKPEVSCLSVGWISQIQASLVLRTSLQRTTYICKSFSFFFARVGKYIHSMVQVERSRLHHIHASFTIPV